MAEDGSAPTCSVTRWARSQRAVRGAARGRGRRPGMGAVGAAKSWYTGAPGLLLSSRLSGVGGGVDLRRSSAGRLELALLSLLLAAPMGASVNGALRWGEVRCC